jgi:hypothetical protein
MAKRPSDPVTTAATTETVAETGWSGVRGTVPYRSGTDGSEGDPAARTMGSPDRSDLQSDAASAGHGALVVLLRRIAEVTSATAAPSPASRTALTEVALVCLARLADDPAVTPVFLAAVPSQGNRTQPADAALPANTHAAAFVDGAGQPFVLLASRLDFRTMIELSPMLILMALAERAARDGRHDAGSLFQALSGLVAPGEPFPDWEIVQGDVRGVRLHGFGLRSAGVRSNPC